MSATNEGRGRFELAPAVRPPCPPPPSIALDVVPVSALTDRGQRFKCEPYRAILSAGTCADRQAARVRNRNTAGTLTVRYQSCDGCALGAEVARRVVAVAVAHKTSAPRKPGDDPYKIPEPVRPPSRLEMQRLRARAL